MNSCLLELSFLEVSCNQEPQKQLANQPIHPIYFSSKNLEKLSNDVARWTHDGKIDHWEKTEILRISGYPIKFHYSLFGTRPSYI